jgi:hypothetical protein
LNVEEREVEPAIADLARIIHRWVPFDSADRRMTETERFRWEFTSATWNVRRLARVASGRSSRQSPIGAELVARLLRAFNLAAGRLGRLCQGGSLESENATPIFGERAPNFDDGIRAPSRLACAETGSVYQARIRADGLRQANELCQRICRAGESCLVKRNRA